MPYYHIPEFYLTDLPVISDYQTNQSICNNNYTEQIEQLKEETKKLQKLYRQTTEETPAYLEFLSDVIRANKILIHYLTIVDLPAS